MNKKRIAIIGSSPLMIILYNRIKKNNSVDVYECSDLGGAWKTLSFRKESFTPHNNVIVALNKNEEKFIDKINKELSYYGCLITEPQGILKLKNNYKPDNIYQYDFFNFFLNFKKNCFNLFDEKITDIKIISNKIFLNKKIYDQVFLPSCFDINQLEINDTVFPIKKKISTSTHLSVFFHKKKFNRVLNYQNYKDIFYSESFDNIFDRGYFRFMKKNFYFTGRVRKKFKKFDRLDLLIKSRALSKFKECIFKTKLNYYNHFIIDESDISKIKLLIKHQNIYFIETRQFVNSYKLLNDYLS